MANRIAIIPPKAPPTAAAGTEDLWVELLEDGVPELPDVDVDVEAESDGNESVAIIGCTSTSHKTTRSNWKGKSSGAP